MYNLRRVRAKLKARIPCPADRPRAVGGRFPVGPVTLVQRQQVLRSRVAECRGIRDFNSDGIPDSWPSGCDGTSNIYLLLGNGDGTFKPPKAIDVGKSSMRISVAGGIVSR